LTKVRKNRGGVKLNYENYGYGTTGNLTNKKAKALVYNGTAGPNAVSSHDGTSFSYNSNIDLSIDQLGKFKGFMIERDLKFMKVAGGFNGEANINAHIC
jgi:hypothetical protein